MHVARYWYQQCLSHSTCRNWRQDSRRLPTRLVRIWKPGNHSPDFISAQLCETTNLPLDIIYVTLSHLWGGNQIFQLRKGNNKELRQSIPFHQLPRVYQDAMNISIEIGTQHIWIDSLCIIQDSKEDWVYEARRMGDVYQYAACNIAAAGYQESTSLGPLILKKGRTEGPPLFADCVLDFPNMGGNHLFKNLYIRAEEAALRMTVDGSVLNSRAWVAQERALSPGIIHFTPEMMSWECNNCVANEGFPTATIYREDERIFRPCKIRSLSVQSDPEDIYAFWRSFIARYARAKLTYERDRFPAAVGIARTLSELIEDNFVAGFWEGDIIKSLIMARHGRIEDVPTTWRAPSWSWASLRAEYHPLRVSSTVQPLSGVKVSVLSDLPGFKTDLDSTSPETSDVRGLEIIAPLRTLSLIDEFYASESSEWFDCAIIEHEILDRYDYSAVDVPEDQAWRLHNPTHVVVLAKGYDYDKSHFAFAVLLQQVPGVENYNTFRKLGVADFCFRTEERLEEYLGLQKENEEYIPSPVLGECGLQEIILI